MISDLKDLLNASVLAPRGDVVLAPEPDWSCCRPVLLPDGTWSPVKEHAKIGVRALIANPYFALFDEMGAMKTAQVIIAAQFLFMMGVINRVLVMAPASVRSVWYDKDLGELSRHLFLDLPSRVSEFHAKIRQWDWGDWTSAPNQLRWIIMNYEFLARSKARQQQIWPYAGPKTLLVLDESSAVANKQTLQSKACLQLRNKCGRVVLLNGTPIGDTPMDLMNQGNLLHPSILGCKYVTTFRERYAVMKPYVSYPEVESWKNLDDIQRRFAPYVLRRLKKDCLDLPEKLPSVVIEVRMSDDDWKLYKPMRDDMVAWLNERDASIAGQALTKAMRLAQITSGFLGGVEEVYEEMPEEALPGFMTEEAWAQNTDTRAAALPRPVFTSVRHVGSAKLDRVLKFFEERLASEPNFKLLVWCRFRPELERLMSRVAGCADRLGVPLENIAHISGGQKRSERELLLRLLNPRTAPEGPVFAGGTYGTGAMGHNFTAVHTVINCSYDYSLRNFKQSADRVHRPGQVHPVSYFDLVAVGPAGQKTIDHSIILARRNKDDVASWTTNAWLDALKEEW